MKVYNLIIVDNVGDLTIKSFSTIEKANLAKEYLSATMSNAQFTIDIEETDNLIIPSMYRWECYSDGEKLIGKSAKLFLTQTDCYNDMRENAFQYLANHSNEKDDEDDDGIAFNIEFTKDTISFLSTLGEYEYKVITINH